MSKRKSPLFFIAIMIISLLLLGLTFKWLLFTPSKQAKSTVDKFYSLEQDGNFSESWSLFHPFMKEKFPKSTFIQDRAHVFIGHFGSETFTFEIGEAKEVKDWKPSEGEEPLKTAFRFIVIQKYSGKYGRFSFIQEVYVVKYKNEWKILWDYNA